jgi:hypothetical protein
MVRFFAVAVVILGACRTERGVRFQHVSHAGEGLTCRSCHVGIFQSTGKEKKRHLPQDAQCTSCHPDPHKGKRYAGTCIGCHGPDVHEERFTEGRDHLVFSHRAHLEPVKGQCFPCHNAIAVRATTLKRLIPRHPECLSCHQKQWDAMECGHCHESLHLYPLKPVSDFSHSGDFLRSHARIAANRPDLCAQCHTQPYCANCHDPAAARFRPPIRWPEEVEKRFIHRGDYVGRHAIEARTAGDQCVRCHARQDCVGCHEARGVSQASGRDPHPPGWVSVVGGPNLHGPAARREIVSCAGCHDQGAASNCVRCHRVGGVGGNPHPPGFRSRLQKNKDRVCRVCHG